MTRIYRATDKIVFSIVHSVYDGGYYWEAWHDDGTEIKQSENVFPTYLKAFEDAKSELAKKSQSKE